MFGSLDVQLGELAQQFLQLKEPEPIGSHWHRSPHVTNPGSHTEFSPFKLVRLFLKHRIEGVKAN
jgi:hypothetical protein